MGEVRKRRQLKPEEKLQIYKEATVARAQGTGSVAEVLRRWGIHSSDLTRITKTVEEGAIVQFKMNRSRKARVVYSEEEMLRWKAERERLEWTVIEQAAEIALIKKTGFRVERGSQGEISFCGVEGIFGERY
jgi:transposase-like protein